MSLQYVIDGYNLIRHPLFNAREKLAPNSQVAILAFIKAKRLTGSPKNKVILVFDGYPKSHPADYDDSNVSFIFSRKVSADEKIKAIVEESSQRKNTVVVSDDKEIKFIVKSLGAQYQGIEKFIRAKEKSQDRQKKELLKQELNYSQMQKINEELKKIWLR